MEKPEFGEAMDEYRRQLERGYLQHAYQGLMQYFRELRSHFADAFPGYSVQSSIYTGQMDMTYFSLASPALKERRLKVPIVFLHDRFRFEIWLSGVNRDVQANYWKRLKESGWEKYHLASNPRVADYVMDHVLIADPDFGDTSLLTARIQRGALEFVRDVEGLLSSTAG